MTPPACRGDGEEPLSEASTAASTADAGLRAPLPGGFPALPRGARWADEEEPEADEERKRNQNQEEQTGVLDEVAGFVKDRIAGFAYHEVQVEIRDARLAVTIIADDVNCVKVGFAPALEPWLTELFGSRCGLREVAVRGAERPPARAVQSAGRGARTGRRRGRSAPSAPD